MQQKDVTVIIPLHEIQTGYKEYLTQAIKSVAELRDQPNETVVVSKSDDVKNTLEDIKSELGYDKLTYLENTTDSTTYQSQVNFAAQNIDTDYFMVLEFDDIVSSKIIQKFNEYSPHYEADMYMPICVDVDKNNPDSKEQLVNISNCGAWAFQSNETLGYLSLQGLENNVAYNFTGCIVNREVFLEVGGLKNNIKLSFNHELMMRLAYNDHRIFILPYIGYKHTINRPGSLFHSYKDGTNPNHLTQGEATSWLQMATQEYFYNEDRELSV